MRSDDGHTADFAPLLEALGRDRHVLGEMIALFLGHAPSLLTELRAAVEMGDDWRTGRIAHRLRGSMALFSSGEAEVPLIRLELMALDGDLREAPAELRRAEHTLNSLMRAMEPYRV